MGKNITGPVQDRLDPKVLVAVLVVGIIELELFSIAAGVSIVAGNDAWLAVLLGGLLMSLVTYLLARLTARFPGENLFQFSKKAWGRTLSYLMAAGYFIFWTVYLTVLMKSFTEINCTFFLRHTPSIIPMVLMAAGAVGLVAYGLPAVVRFFQLMFPFLLLPLVVIFLLCIKNLQLESFMPVLASGIMPVVKGAVMYAGAIQGLEILVFIGPFLTDTRKALKPALLGISIVNLIAFLEVVFTVGLLGVKNTQELVWPSISMLGYLEAPGLHAERFDLLLSTPMIIGVFTTICLYVYLLAYGIMQVFGLNSRKVIIIGTITVPVLATYLIPNFAWTMKIRSVVDYVTLAFVILIPIITLIIAILRSKAAEQS